MVVVGGDSGAMDTELIKVQNPVCVFLTNYTSTELS